MAIQTKYTGDKVTDGYLANIYQILNDIQSKMNKFALRNDLVNTNKIVDILRANGIYVDLTETNEKLQLKRNGASGTVYTLIVEDPTEV